MGLKLTRYFSDFKIILVFLAIWSIAIIFVGPSGDFPLNDDWAYARGVFRMDGLMMELQDTEKRKII